MGLLVLLLKAIDWLIFHLPVEESEDYSENHGFLEVWHLLIINNLRLHLHESCGMRRNTFLVIKSKISGKHICMGRIQYYHPFYHPFYIIINTMLLENMGFYSRRLWRSVWHITPLQSIILLFVEKGELLWTWLVNSYVVKLSISVIQVFYDHVQLLSCEFYSGFVHFAIHWILQPKYVCCHCNILI